MYKVVNWVFKNKHSNKFLESFAEAKSKEKMLSKFTNSESEKLHQSSKKKKIIKGNFSTMSSEFENIIKSNRASVSTSPATANCETSFNYNESMGETLSIATVAPTNSELMSNDLKRKKKQRWQ